MQDRADEVPPPTTSIDRRNCTRIVPMKVLVLGLPRTGTRSIRTALKELGYDETYHMRSARYENSLDCDLWIQAIRAKYDGEGEFTKENWDGLLGHCMAVTDFPAALFGPELIAAYPSAKVILTNRNVDTWHTSVMDTIIKGFDTWYWWGLSFLISNVRRDWIMTTMLFDRFAAGNFFKNGKNAFEEHYKHIRVIMKDRPDFLLEYEVKQGWDPLCRFLGQPVPEQDFPRLNDTKSFKMWRHEHILGHLWREQGATIVSVSAVSVACGTALWARTVGL